VSGGNYPKIQRLLDLRGGLFKRFFRRPTRRTDPRDMGARNAEIRLMEAARGPGHYASAEIASGMTQAAASNLSAMDAMRGADGRSFPERLIGTGDLNIAVGQGTARTMDEDAGRRPADPKRSDEAQANRATRFSATCEMFLILNRIRPEVLVESGATGAAINDIRTAFRGFMQAWLAAQAAGTSIGDDAPARRALVAAITRFVQMRNTLG